MTTTQEDQMEHAVTGPQYASKIAPGAPALNGMVGEYAEQTETALTGLHTLIDKLVDRLTPVLQVAPPSGGPTAAQTKPMASPLGERMRAQVIGVQNAAARVEELLARLDL